MLGFCVVSLLTVIGYFACLRIQSETAHILNINSEPNLHIVMYPTLVSMPRELNMWSTFKLGTIKATT